MDRESAARTIYGKLSDHSIVGRPAYTFVSLKADFKKQFPDFAAVFTCLQLLPGNRVRITSPDEEACLLLWSTGLSFRGFPVVLTRARCVRNVKIHRLPFELPLHHVRGVLAEYGLVEELAREKDEVFTGVLIAKMEIKNPIPSRINVRGQPAVVVYRGQTRTCFTCGSVSHENRNCPRRAKRPRPAGTSPQHTPTTNQQNPPASSVPSSTGTQSSPNSSQQSPPTVPIPSTIDDQSPPTTTVPHSNPDPPTIITTNPSTSTSPTPTPVATNTALSESVVIASTQLDVVAGAKIPLPEVSADEDSESSSDESESESGLMIVTGNSSDSEAQSDTDTSSSTNTVTPMDSTGPTHENPTTSSPLENPASSMDKTVSSDEEGWTQVTKRRKHADPTARKRTTPSIRSSFPSTADAQKEIPPPESSKPRDRSPILELYLTNSGNLKYTDVVVRGTIPNPPYVVTPDGQDADYTSQELFTSAD